MPPEPKHIEQIAPAPQPAARLMIQDVPIIPPSATIADAERVLTEHAKTLTTINYLYVATQEKKLSGVISIKAIFREPKNTPVATVMQRDLVTARAHTKQGKIAALAIEHNIKEVPIVDAAGTLLGVVPHDVILSILREEHINETLRSAGVTSFDDSIKTMSGARATTLIKKRLPWLFIGLVGSSLAALIIQFFQGTLEEQILLASFIPAVMYISGAVSVQSETLLIRTELVDTRFSFSRYLTRELAVGGGLAVTLSLAMGGLSFLIWQSTIVSAVLALSFFVAIIIASMVAISLPWASSKLNIDPALSGGPLDTILSDIISITVYFAIANLLIRTLT